MSLDLDQPSCSKSYVESNADTLFARQLLEQLKPVDDLLKCHICFDYFTTCMITKCSHSYCSLCIRRYMAYKAQCPECFKEATETELRSDRLIDQLLLIYNKIRSFIEAAAGTLGTKLVNSISQKPITTFSIADQGENSQSFDCSESSNDEPLLVVDHSMVERNTSDVPTAVPQVGTSTQSMEKVTCPACSALVFSSRINSHLDTCLSNDSVEPFKSEGRQRQPLPKVVYHLLTDKEIKKRLKDHGLSTSGSRQSLIRRHKNFLILYNSECDSLNPRQVSEIVKQVESEEGLTSSTPAKLFQSSKRSSRHLIVQENEQYLRQNDRQFGALINEIRSRQGTHGKTKARCVKQVFLDTDSEFSDDDDYSENFPEFAVSQFVDDSPDDGSPELFDSPVILENVEPETVTINCDPENVLIQTDESLEQSCDRQLRSQRPCNRNSQISLKSTDSEESESYRRSQRLKRKLSENQENASSSKQ